VQAVEKAKAFGFDLHGALKVIFFSFSRLCTIGKKLALQ
jgi:hypothetical protein